MIEKQAKKIILYLYIKQFKFLNQFANYLQFMHIYCFQNEKVLIKYYIRRYKAQIDILYLLEDIKYRAFISHKKANKLASSIYIH